MKDVEALANALRIMLKQNSPVMSGNMQEHISDVIIGDKELTIVIDAPFYDVSEYKRTGKIIYTGAKKNGKEAYANDVNLYGGFFTKNSSMEWVDRTIIQVCNTFANHMGAELVKL